jgi:purine-binding chemotaxis protein CheW
VTRRQYCTFTVADSLYGIPVAAVQELLRSQRMTPVPRAPRGISGLINLRGQIVPAVESRERLLLPPRAPDAASMNVVVGSPWGPVAIVVDAVGDVLEVDETAFEQVPDTVPEAGRELIVAACKLEHSLLLVLDVPAMANVRTQVGLRA